MFDTTANDNSNRESVLEESDLIVRAAAAKKHRSSILKGNRSKKILRASEMPVGAVSKIMASKQMKVMDRDKASAYLTYAGNMVNIDYSRCDSLVSIVEPVGKDSHYKVNLPHSY